MGLPLRNGRRVLPKKGALAERQSASNTPWERSGCMEN